MFAIKSQTTKYTDDISGISIELPPMTHLFRYIDSQRNVFLYTARQYVEIDNNSTDDRIKYLSYVVSRIDDRGRSVYLATIAYHLIPKSLRERADLRQPFIVNGLGDSKNWLHNRMEQSIIGLKASKTEYAVKNVIAIDQGLMTEHGQRDFRPQIEHLNNRCNFNRAFAK